MTQVDSRIALGVQPLDVGTSIGNAFKLKYLSQQADAAKLDNEIKQQAVQKQKTLGDLYRGALGPDGKIDRTKVTQGVVEAGYGADLPDLQKGWLEGDKSQAEYQSKIIENGTKANDYTTKAIAGLMMRPGITPADVHSEIGNLAKIGVLTPDQAQTYSAQVPNTTPQALDSWLRSMFHQALSTKEQLERLTPNVIAQNLGGHTEFVDMNPNTNPGVVGQRLERTASPESVLSASTAVRGQDMTDARARDLNATKVEENKLKREAKEEASNQAKASQLASFDTMLGTLDRLSNHAGLARSVGVYGALPTMPGSDSANFQAELETFKSQAFIPMVAQLKGMGALSDAEGKKLSAAVGALDPKMGEKAFRESIGRIIADMRAARDRLAGGTKQGASASQSTSGGVLSPQQSGGSPYAASLQKRIDAGLMTKEQANAFLQSKGLKPEFANGNDSRTGSW